MHGLTRASVIACMVGGCGVVAQSLSSASYLPTDLQLLALLAAVVVAFASALLAPCPRPMPPEKKDLLRGLS